eukprot:3936035-Rhodomonas_salina.3
MLCYAVLCWLICAICAICAVLRCVVHTQQHAHVGFDARRRDELLGVLWKLQLRRGAWSSTASSHMMHACFPPHVAEVLLRGDVPSEVLYNLSEFAITMRVADRHTVFCVQDRSECSTVFFADVACFTAISATMESGK